MISLKRKDEYFILLNKDCNLITDLSIDCNLQLDIKQYSNKVVIYLQEFQNLQTILERIMDFIP